jgi:hypothetical protein
MKMAEYCLVDKNNNQHKMKFEVAELLPCKRTFRFILNDKKIVLFLPMPYIQFYVLREYSYNNLIDTKVKVSVTTKPFNYGNTIYKLPLSNQYNGKICFGNNAIKFNPTICAEIYLTSWFTGDYGGDMIDFVRENGLSPRNWRSINLQMMQSINKNKKWSLANPLKLQYDELHISEICTYNWSQE